MVWSECCPYQKLRNVLDRFLSESFNNVQNAKFEVLLTHLSKNENGHLLRSPPVLTWIDECLNILIEDYTTIQHKVTSFVFKLCGIIAESMWTIISSSDEITFRKISSIAEVNLQNFTSSTIVGHVRFLTSVSKCILGFRWIRASKSWRYLIKYYHQNRTVYVAREASNLLFNILYELSKESHSKDLCLEILNEILEPMDHDMYKNTSAAIKVDEEKILRRLSSTLDLISALLKKALRIKEKNLIAYLCEIYHKLNTNFCNLIEEEHSKKLLEKLLIVQTSYNFLFLLNEKLKHNGMVPIHCTHFGVNFFKTVQFCKDRKECVLFLKQVELYLYLWETSPTEIFIENERTKFQSQLILYQVLPILCLCENLKRNKESVDQYVIKLLEVSSKSVDNIFCTFRDILFNCPDLAAHLAQKSIPVILSLGSILHERASVIFQVLVYVLEEIVMYIRHEKNIRNDLNRNTSQILHVIFVNLHAIIGNDTLSWTDYIELTRLIDIVLVVLKNQNFPHLMKVQTVKLAQISIEHILTPNMKLQHEKLQKCEVQNLSLIIIENINNAEWEVRDSILELVTSVVSVSHLNFPQLERMLMENEICSLVYCIVKTDQEHFVRASGLKCLAEMVSVDLLWEKCIVQLNIIEYLMWVICNENEAIVRKEATSLLTKMHEHRRINLKSLSKVYCVLAYCAVHDLFWEVQIAALNFWEKDIFLRFANQGLIDGTIHSVMFSTEIKNIDTLGQQEYMVRIRKVLSELSQIGCLDVIIESLEEHCDLEPVNVAVRIIRNILKVLTKYDFKMLLDVTGTVGTKKKHTSFEMLKEENNDLGIKSNLKCCEIMKIDVDSTVYRNDMQCSSNSQQQVKFEWENKFDCLASKKLIQVFAIKPEEFLDRLKNIDFDNFVETRRKCLYCSENITSFLDEIVRSGECNQPCLMECY